MQELTELVASQMRKKSTGSKLGCVMVLAAASFIKDVFKTALDPHAPAESKMANDAISMVTIVAGTLNIAR